MTEKKEAKKESSAEKKLIDAGKEVGKAIARSSFKAEKTGREIKKKVEETVSRLSSNAKKITKEVAKKAKSPFSTKGDMVLNDQIGFVAGEIYEHLSQHGEMATEKLVSAIMKRNNSNAMVFCAVGWLAREGKINLSQDGSHIALRAE
ncbi:MAG: winged helix-turn-helix domain-containing protein [Deltaproteobacteria bacterium]|nr:winged helix-turn-helix domain-containing protein [Deltaproteobacteria bacterium]